jgi:D-inositol-3-phosphate glycosyltransferase
MAVMRTLSSLRQPRKIRRKLADNRGLSTGMCPSTKTLTKDLCDRANLPSMPPCEIQIGLLTGGRDPHYAFGLAMALVSKGVGLDLIGSDEVDYPELHSTPGLNFFNLRRNQRSRISLTEKIARVLVYYIRLIWYAARAKPRIFHILWNNKFEFFDRTLLMLYYKALRKKVVLTAHNVNAGKRDLNDSVLNRLTLWVQYRLTDHIFVHTQKMKDELRQDFGVREQVISVIPYGINNSVPDTDLTPAEAKQRLGIKEGERTVLFFGAIRPYKGVEYLLAAFRRLTASRGDYRLIIAGEPKKESKQYVSEIQRTIDCDFTPGQIIQKFQCIQDGDVELYFKAADVLVLPYKEIFQSGVLFLGFSFGLPAVAADVGSFKEEVIEGKTGLLYTPGDPIELGNAIEKYFESDLFKGLTKRRQEIREYTSAEHSWDQVGETTRNVYAQLRGDVGDRFLSFEQRR